MDQPSNETVVAGVKIATAVYAFFGAAISLSYAKEMSPLQVAISVVSGVITSVAVQPLVMVKFDLSPSVSNSIAFLLGLISMRAIPVVLAVVDRFKKVKLPALPDAPAEADVDKE